MRMVHSDHLGGDEEWIEIDANLRALVLLLAHRIEVGMEDGPTSGLDD